jgi:hypothetical protein
LDDIGGDVYTKRALREKCKTYPGGLYFFAKAVCGFNRTKEELHLPFANYLQMHPEFFFDEGMRELGNGGHQLSNRKLAWMPREHFKSTFASIALPLWLLSCVDRNLTIALISAHSDNTKKWLRQIRNIIQYNGFFRALFPHIRPGGKWDETEIIVTRDQDLSGDAQASITAYSIKSGLASQHHHYIILDDPVNEQVANSDVEMETAVNLYIHLEEILRGWKQSGFLVIGTPWGREDVLEEAKQEEKRGYRLKWGIGARGEFEISEPLGEYLELIPDKCFPEVIEKREYPNRVILPSECDEDKLNHIKGQSVEKLHMQYLCKPFAAGRNGFDLDLMRYFAQYPDGLLKCECPEHRDHSHHLADGVTIVVSDPAYTQDKTGCETAILIGNIQPCSCRFLLHEWGGHIHPSEYIPHASYTANEWRTWLKAWCVEDEALQVTLRQWMEDAQSKGNFPLGVQIHGLKVKNRSKDGRIAAAQTPVNNGWWHIRPTMRLVEGVNNTVHQIYQWPYSRKRDRADAFAYFDEGWEEFPVLLQREEEQEEVNINAWREQQDAYDMLMEDMAE